MKPKFEDYLANITIAKNQCAEKIKNDIYSFARELFGKDLEKIPEMELINDFLAFPRNNNEEYVKRKAIEIIDTRYNGPLEELEEDELEDNGFLIFCSKGLFIHERSDTDCVFASLERREAPVVFYTKYGERILKALHTAFRQQNRNPE